MEYNDIFSAKKIKFHQWELVVVMIEHAHIHAYITHTHIQVHLRCCISCCESFDSSEQLLSHMTIHGHFTLPADTAKWDQPQ